MCRIKTCAGMAIAIVGTLTFSLAALAQSELSQFNAQLAELRQQYLEAALAGDLAKKQEVYEKILALELELGISSGESPSNPGSADEPGHVEDHDHGGSGEPGEQGPDGSSEGPGLGSNGSEAPHDWHSHDGDEDVFGALVRGLAASGGAIELADKPVLAKSAAQAITERSQLALAKIFVETLRKKMGAKNDGSDKSIEIRIVDTPEFNRAWQDMCDRHGTPPTDAPASVNAFVDDTLKPPVAFIRRGKDIGTMIHESLHLRAHSTFVAASKNGKSTTSLNEGVTEYLTRLTIGAAGLEIQRNNYAEETKAVFKLQMRVGPEAIAQWYFDGDASTIVSKLGKNASRFEDWKNAMRSGDTATAMTIFD